jgi:hypothetical protein
MKSYIERIFTERLLRIQIITEQRDTHLRILPSNTGYPPLSCVDLPGSDRGLLP